MPEKPLLTCIKVHRNSVKISWDINLNRQTFCATALIYAHITVTFIRYEYKTAKFTEIPCLHTLISRKHYYIYRKLIILMSKMQDDIVNIG